MPINSLSKFEKLPDSNQSTAFKLDTQLFFWLNPEHDSWKKDWTSGLTNRKKLFELPILRRFVTAAGLIPVDISAGKQRLMKNRHNI